MLDGCRRAGLAVPEEVAVLGVDNDEVLCALSPPPMSRVILNPRRGGWEAAALLRLNRASLDLAYLHKEVADLGVSVEFGEAWRQAFPDELAPKIE